LTPRGLAERLKRHAVRPRTIRLADGLSRGYLARDFTSAFERYLRPAEREEAL